MASSSGASTLQPTGRPRSLPPRGHQAIRECPRSLCQVQWRWNQKGRLGHLAFPRRWLTKLLLSTIAIASAVIEGNTRPFSEGEVEAQSQTYSGSTLEATPHSGHGDHGFTVQWMDELQGRLHSPHGPLDGGPAARGLQHPGAGLASDRGADDGGRVRLPERRVLQGAAQEDGDSSRQIDADTSAWPSSEC